MTWRILITDGIAPEGLELLRAAAEVVESSKLDHVEEFDALIVRGRTQVTATVLEAGSPRLKLVGRAGVGVDNIDVPAALRLGIVVVNAPQAATVAVSELAFALMLSLARSLPHAHASMTSGNWEKSRFMGTELSGKTLGVVGVGRIGSAVVERGLAFGMQVLGCDPRARRVVRRGATAVDFDELLARSHFVTLHVPLTDETLGMLDAAALAKMRPGAYLISTARGEIIDEADLLGALDAGRLGGAALDVYATEPPENTALIQHPRVITTPHIGAQTREAQARISTDIAAEVLAGLRGEPLRWQVH